MRILFFVIFCYFSFFVAISQQVLGKDKSVVLQQDEVLNNSERDFSITLPAWWEFSSEDEVFYAPTSLSNSKYRPRFSISFLNSSKVESKKAGQFLTSSMNKTFSSWRKLEEGYINIGPKRLYAYYVEIKAYPHSSSTAIRFRQYLIWGKNNKAYVIQFSASPKYFDSTFAEFKPYLESFGPAMEEKKPIIVSQPTYSNPSDSTPLGIDKHQVNIYLEPTDYKSGTDLSYSLSCSTNHHSCGKTEKMSAVIFDLVAFYFGLPNGSYVLNFTYQKKNGSFSFGSVPFVLDSSDPASVAFSYRSGQTIKLGQ